MTAAEQEDRLDVATKRKWDAASRTFDLVSFADVHRFGPHKRRLFSRIRGATLMVAAGTGIAFFQPGHSILAIDISPAMLERAGRRASRYEVDIELRQMDVCELALPDASFDTVVTVCTMCSVPKPIRGLRELHRVLRPNGQLLMFEHVLSRIGPLGVLLDLMTPLSRRFGPDLNRDTVENARGRASASDAKRTSTSTS